MSKRIQYNHGDLINGVMFIQDEPSIRQPSGGIRRMAKFSCPYCGNKFIAYLPHVKNGHTQSCGCLTGSLVTKKNTVHGLSHERLYPIWCSIKSRCNNKNFPAYRYYGGRGIALYNEWNSNFKGFYDYMMSLPNADKPKYTIDRIDNDGNYEPGNVRWVSRSVQSRNTRSRGQVGLLNITRNHWNPSKYNVCVLNKHVGVYDFLIDAIKARNKFIIDNKLEGYYLHPEVDDNTL